MKKSLPLFKDVEEIRSFAKFLEIVIIFDPLTTFVESSGRVIKIHSFLEDNVKSFLIVKHIAHIINNTQCETIFGESLSTEGVMSINALRGMNANKKDGFTFDSLMEYYQFHVLKDIIKQP